MHEHDKTLWCSLDELQMLLGSCKQNGYNFKAEILPALFVYNRWGSLKKKENRRILLGKKYGVWRYILLCLLVCRFYNDLFVRNKTLLFFYSSIPAVFGCKGISVWVLCTFLNSNIFFYLSMEVPSWEHASVFAGREISSGLNMKVQIRICSYIICYCFALDLFWKRVHTLKYTYQENVWLDFPPALIPDKGSDIYRQWTTSNNIVIKTYH